MGDEFALGVGRQREMLNRERERRRPELDRGAHDYLDAEYWASEVFRGEHIARTMLAESVNWLFRRMYTRGNYGEFESDVCFLAAQRRFIGELDIHSDRREEGWIGLRRALVADAALHWCAAGCVATEPLQAASRCFETRVAHHGGLDKVVAESLHEADEEFVELMLAPEFVRRAILADWNWIFAAYIRNFDYLSGNAKRSANGYLIAFCYRLGQVVEGEGARAEREAACRSALTDASWSWTNAFLADRPWDAALELLYLCVYAFEFILNGTRRSVFAVNEAIRGTG